MRARPLYTASMEAGGKPTSNADADLLFPWWSFTKTVIAASALQLVRESRLQLDQALPGRPYTLRQLLQHRAGVPEYGRLDAYHQAVMRGDDPWPIDELLERVDADRLDFAPDEGWAYSNVGYLFVRQLIEETTGAAIETALRDHVFAPLGLSSPTVVLTPAALDAVAFGNAERYHPGWVYHGLLIGSAVGFLDGLMACRLLPPDLVAVMTALHPLGGPLPGRPWETTGYGLGLMSGQMAKVGAALGHSGAGPGSVAAVYHFPDLAPPSTAAAFTQADHEGITEQGVVDLVTG